MADSEELEKMFADELDIFKVGEDYSFVKDLRDGFDEGLRSSAAEKIFATLPDHVFYDIKKPLNHDCQIFMNNYNPARKYYNSHFFDMRQTERYFMH